MKRLLSYTEIKTPRKPKPQVGVKKLNAKRKGHRFPKLVNQPLRAFTVTLPCVIAGRRDRQGVLHRCRTLPMCCHLKPRGTAGPDDENVFSACWDAHREQEGHTKEFEWQWQIRLKPICRQTTAAFYRRYPELRKRKLQEAHDAES